MSSHDLLFDPPGLIGSHNRPASACTYSEPEPDETAKFILTCGTSVSFSGRTRMLLVPCHLTVLYCPEASTSNFLLGKIESHQRCQRLNRLSMFLDLHSCSCRGTLYRASSHPRYTLDIATTLKISASFVNHNVPNVIIPGQSSARPLKTFGVEIPRVSSTL